MPKKQMKFKDGGKVKHYYTGSQVSRDSDSEDSSSLRGRDLPPIDEMEYIKSDVRRALAGEPPISKQYKYDYTQLPPSKDNSVMSSDSSASEKKSGLAKAVKKVEKSQGTDPRMFEAMMSRGSRAGVSQIPGQSMTAEQREGINKGERVTGTELGRNVSNTLAALTPLGGGVGKIGSELALGSRATKAATAEKLSPAGQRLKNMEEIRNVAMPGRRDAVMNPMAHAGGPKMMEKIAAQEGRAVQAEARAAQAAARKKAAQAKKDAKDPVMQSRPNEMKKGGAVKKYAKGGSVSSASSRADGCAIRGKTKGMISKMKSGGMC